MLFRSLRRRDVGFALLLLRVSAPRREMAFVIASWISCFTAGWGDAIEGGAWVEFSRRDAEAQRVWICDAFSQRLCASAGDGFRDCIVEFLFHGGMRAVIGVG